MTPSMTDDPSYESASQTIIEVDDTACKSKKSTGYLLNLKAIVLNVH